MADRVAIMAAGSVKCCGTLAFLKRHFGGAGRAAAAAERKAKREAEAAAKIAEAEAAGDIRAAEKIAEALAEAERADAAAAPAVDLGGGLHVAVTTAAAARDRLKAVFAQHVPEAKLAAASKLAEDLRRATERTPRTRSSGRRQRASRRRLEPLLNATRGASFSASRNWADAEAPLLEDAADDATTTYTVPAAVGRARMVALFEGLEEKADGLGLVDLSVTATSLEDVFISVGEKVEGAAAPWRRRRCSAGPWCRRGRASRCRRRGSSWPWLSSGSSR